MAKNKAQVNVNHYANQEEAIRKAKGNPNKNVHHKKKNSNYGGYTAGNYMAQKIMDKAAQQERVQLPTWLKVWLGVVFGALLVVGFMTLTSLQTFLNIAVVTGLVPATGISLPFFSYGGTALLCQLAEMGIVLSVSRQMPAPQNG